MIKNITILLGFFSLIFAQTTVSGVVTDENNNPVADANIGSIFGWGFAPVKGGTLQFVNDYGIQEFEKRSQELAKKYGERFNPPRMLKKMASKKEMF